MSSGATARLDGRGARPHTTGKAQSARQALGAGLARERNQMLEISRIVDIDCNPRQLQHDTGFAGGPGGGVVRFEAVIAEAQREQSCRAAEGGVGAASIGRRGQYRAFRRSIFQNRFQFAGRDQRNVGRDDEGEIGAAAHAELSRQFDCSGFSGSIRIGDDFEVVLPGEFDGEGVAGDNGNGRTSRPRGNSGEHILQHGLREFGASRLSEHGGEALLGLGEIFDGDKNHGGWLIKVDRSRNEKARRRGRQASPQVMP